MRVQINVDTDDRVTGLLEANNRYLERARLAERRLAILATALDRIADAACQGGDEGLLQTILEIAADALTEIR